MDLPALGGGDLRDQVSSRAEPVEAEPPGAFAGRLEAPPSDEAGAHQGCDPGGLLRQHAQRQAEVGFGDDVARESAVAVVAGEARRIAQVLAAAGAEGAVAATVAEPGHADAIADPVRIHSGSERLDHADDLVAGHDGQHRQRQVAIHHVEVRAADGAGQHAQAKLAGARLGQRPMFHPQRLTWAGEHHRLHHLHGRGDPVHERCCVEPRRRFALT